MEGRRRRLAPGLPVALGRSGGASPPTSMPSLPHGKSKFVSPLVKSTPAAAASSSRPTSNLELKRKASALEGPSTSSTLPRKKTGPPLAVRALQPDRKVFYGVAQMQQEAGEASADAADDAYW